MQEQEKSLEIIRHSMAHILASAILELYPQTKFGIGPTIPNGFYYDFDFTEKITPEDLPKIEAKMREILKNNFSFTKSSTSFDKAREIFKEQPYKLDLIAGLEKAGETEATIYTSGNFTDLCRGPHIASSQDLNTVAFKLEKLAGAYWHGDEKNKMLTRIYALAFETQAELDDYLHLLEEAEKRDHRKLGKELGLFSFHDEGPGFPFFKPKGMVIWNQLLDYWRRAHAIAGYQEIKTPIMLSRKLWETSGHWENYRENMYETKIDDLEYAIKPMNCPGSLLMFTEEVHSYRELPLRWGEIGLVHRHELSGVLSGLFRVRTFHQDDAHIFMRPDQIKDEILGVLNLVDKMYSTFGLTYHLELSTKPTKAIGSDEAWESATNGLKDALDSIGKEYKINEGDGAFYGPKIDIHIKDALGRTWQCGTIQLDMNLPERFNLNYIDHDGSEQRPVMIHRVIYGSVERFFGILIEHYAGNFPVWLAPVQIKILSVGEKHQTYCQDLVKELTTNGLRAELDISSETVGKKIRNATMEKVPYILVIGDKELEGGEFSLKVRGSEELLKLNKTALIEKIQQEGKIA